MIAPFEASRLKLNRAREHFAELETATAAYFSEKPCAIVVEKFPGMEMSYGSHAWVARIRNPIPIRFAAIIGDVIHNLRTALDLLMSDLVRINGGNTDGVYFPFCAKADELDRAIKDKKVRRAGDDVVAALRSIKPYPTGNALLRAIHDMDVSDKHQALLPVLGAVSLPLGAILGRNIPEQIRTFSTLINKDGQIVVGTPALSVPLGTELPARFFLAFGEGRGFKGRQVSEFLVMLTEEADRVCKALTALRPGTVVPIANSGSTA